jgi:hypothetical protein
MLGHGDFETDRQSSYKLFAFETKLNSVQY